jgi:predicted HTH transcriptional regulator
MGIINDLFGKEPEKVCVDDIRQLIKERKEESHTLEYKEPRILKQPEDFSKWISAFLNSDGGVIVVGVSEDNPEDKEKINARIFPKAIEFVKKEFSKEKIDQIIVTNVYSSVRPDIRVYPIRNGDNIDESIYLVEVPKGDIPPYQAGDKRYYRRINSTKFPMNHTEIADFFGRRKNQK